MDLIKTKLRPALLIFMVVMIVLLLLAGSARTAQAATRYVKAGGTGSQNGSSWTNAYSSIQTAINTAAAGDEIWVAAGVYNERIILDKNITLYGGFAGNESVPTQRNWRANDPDAIFRGAIIDGVGKSGTVVTVSNGVSVRIDGFVIRSGSATKGGGVNCGYMSKPVINNNLILFNNASSYGGGIYCDVESIPEITGNLILLNTAQWGGGIYLVGSDNTYTHHGGANGFIIINNLIRNNGDGVTCSGAGIVSNNTIVADTGSATGDGLQYSKFSPTSTAAVTISNNIITGHSGTDRHGIYVVSAGSFTVTNNYCYNNTVNYRNGGTTVNLPDGNGNSNVNPLFVEGDLNFHLQPGSPCINAGTTANGEYVSGDLDFDGKPRQNGTIDIGAYEWYLTATISGPAMNATNQNPFTVDITFNANVSDFAAADLTVASTYGTPTFILTGSANQYTATINNPVEAKVTISLAAGSVHANANGLANATATLAVIYDTEKPDIYNFHINNDNPTNNIVVSWQIMVQDLPSSNYSGTYQMRLSNDGVTWSDWMPYDSTIANYNGWTLGTPDANNTVYAQARDRAGNISTTKSASIAWAKAAAPTFSPAAGTYNTPVSITMTTITNGATIRYTTDGSDVSDTSTLYSGPIQIAVTTTLRAKAFHADDWLPSDEVSATYAVASSTVSYQPVVPAVNVPPTAPNILLTAQNIDGDLSVQYNSATLRLGNGKTGKLSDLWLYYPNLIGSGSGQVPEVSQIVQAKLVLTLKESSGQTNKPYGFKIYRITDPYNKGVPYFGGDGIRNGLDFQYRDHRPGMNVPWTNGVNTTIRDILNAGNLEDSFELVPAVCQAKGYNTITLDVTAALQKWAKREEPNQGWFLTIDTVTTQWLNGDQLVFYGVGADNAGLRPYLEVTFLTGSLTRPAAVSVLTAASGNGQVTLTWTNTNSDPVRVVRKEGIVPGSPQDGILVAEKTTNNTGLTDTGLSNGTIYYYAVFRSDAYRDYSRRAWVKATPGNGTISAPSGLTGSITGNQLTLSWSNTSLANADWLIIERKLSSTGNWDNPDKLVYLAANQTQAILDLTDPNLGFSPNTGYKFQIEAVNSNKTNNSAATNTWTTPTTIPNFLPAPANLVWTIISAGRVNLSWTMATGADGYRVEVYRPGDTQTVLWSYPLASDATACSVTGLGPGTEYLIKVVAVRGTEEAAAWTEPVKTAADYKGGLL